MGRTQEAGFISEGDVYRLISHSKLPAAEQFECWVFDEVLPQIRTTGGYIPSSPSDTEMDVLAKAYLIACRTVEENNAEIGELKTKVKQLEPEAQAYIDLMTADGYLKFIDVAGMVEIGRTALMGFLREQKVLTKQSGFYVPYARYLKNGCFRVICAETAEGYISSVTMVSPKGLDLIYKLIMKNRGYVDLDPIEISSLGPSVA